MSISLLGIIGVQILWIRNAIKIEEKKFDSNVFKALNGVVQKLEQDETVHLIQKELVHANNQKDSNLMVTELSEFIDHKKSTKHHKIFISKSDSIRGGGHHYISNDTKIILTTPEKRVARKIIPGKIHLDSSFAVDIKINTMDTIRILRKEKEIQNVLNKVIWEYKFNNTKIEDRIKREEIALHLANSLSDFSIDTEYEYGVIDSKRDNTILASTDRTSENLIQSPYRVRLFPGDIWFRENYLTVFFPNKTNHVFRTLIPLLLLSGIFTLFILGTFILALILILRQKRINDVKSDFINNITHEFKTPIATIGLAADSIVNPKIIGTPDRIRYFTSLIKDENYRMNKQVENILQLSLLDKRELELNPQPLHVNELLQKASEHMQLQISERQGELKCKWEAVNDMSHLDEVHFINVIFNLIDNAIKYSKEKPMIELGTKNENHRIIIWIQDKGIGMNKKTLNKIFEKFYRAESGNLHRVKGFGLGLSYVKLVVDRHDGRINVISKQGKGTRVEISVPVMH